MKKVKLNKKQQQAVDLILSGVNVFLTGDAGTGKTTVVQQSVKALERQDIEESKEKDKNGETVIVKKIVRKIVGSFKQFPIKIAWAMSIHKSQGQTFGQVNIDPRCWDSGQFYVAVSRAESVAGIHFMAPIMKQYIRTLSDEVIKILRESLYSII